MRQALIAIILSLVFIGASESNAQDSLNTALTDCAGIADDAARLACFDGLATVMVDDPPGVSAADEGNIDAAGSVATATAASAVVVAEATSVPLTDEVGKERLEPKDDDEQPRFTANVINCQKSAQSGQHYFTFENGQVWKQSNYRSLNIRDCDFGVEISKGGLGYNMYIPSKDRSVRVARVK